LERLGTDVLVCDGAMGTMLHAAGISLDRALPELNLSRPELVGAVHAAYLAAGSDIIETNTFGVTRHRLARHGLEESVVEINRAAVTIARRALKEAGSSAFVAGSIGPPSPVGQRGAIDVAEAVAEQVGALSEAGVDLLMFETFGSLDMLRQSIVAARESGSLPIVAQMTFLEDGRTIAGDTPDAVASLLEALGVAAIGVNCTLGPSGIRPILSDMARRTTLPLCVQPNAGLPARVLGRFEYAANEQYFAQSALKFAQAGAAIVGGCCGTTPRHIELTAKAVRGIGTIGHPRRAEVAKVPAVAERVAGLGPVNRLSERLNSGQFVLACELRPRDGSDPAAAIEDAVLLKEAGAHALVIPPIETSRAHMSPVTLGLLLRERLDMDTILTATTWDKSILGLQADLLGAHAFGLRTVICHTGTPPPHGDYPNDMGIWDVDSIGLIELLRSLNEGRDHAGMPIRQTTSFLVGAFVNPTASDPETELDQARRKLAAGANFLVTQPIFDVEALESFLARLGAIEVPVLAELMPLRSFEQAEYVHYELPDTRVPEAVLDRLRAAGPDGPAVGQALTAAFLGECGDLVNGAIVVPTAGSPNETAELVRTLVGTVDAGPR